MASSIDQVDSRTSPDVNSPQANYVLGMVTFAYILAFVDRQLLNLLVEPIKLSLLISDTQFSLIQGTAFVVAYMAAAPIFGRLVDVANRRNILVFGVLSWSFFTAISGMCDTYQELFLARMGVGITEACIFPVAWSLIGDCYSNEKLPTALSVFSVAPQLGGGFSLIAGGLIIGFAATLTATIPTLSSLETWQMAFVVTGVPGIFFALLIFTIKEPLRTTNPVKGVEDRQLTKAEVGRALWTNRSFYGRIYLGIGMIAIVQLAIPSWFPAFMIRAHELTAAETGLRLGVISAIVGPIGTFAGPVASGWLRKRGYADSSLRAAAWCTIPMLISAFLIPIAPTPNLALTAAAGVIFCCGFPVGIMAAATQTATPCRMRGVVASIYTFSAQLIGYMIGPTLVALFTDYVFRDPRMVGYSMQIVMSSAALVAGLLLFSVLPRYREIIGQENG